jgi:hypothetical protein
MERVDQHVNTPEVAVAKLGRVQDVLVQLRAKEDWLKQGRKDNKNQQPSFHEIGIEFARRVLELSLGDQPGEQIRVGPLSVDLDFKGKGGK